MSLRKQLGFTLVEILIVLAVIGILLFLSIPFTSKFLDNITEKKILEMFQYDVLYIQNQSFGSTDYPRLLLYKNHYIVKSSGNEEIIRDLPKGWKLNSRILPNISFNEFGTIRYAGRIEISTPRNTYHIIFPPGKGRGYIEKQ